MGKPLHYGLSILCLHTELQINIQTKMQTSTEIGQKTRIKRDVLLKMNDNGVFKAKMCATFENGYHTVQRWIKTNDIMLTTEASLRLIESEFKLKRNQIIENYE